MPTRCRVVPRRPVASPSTQRRVFIAKIPRKDDGPRVGKRESRPNVHIAAPAMDSIILRHSAANPGWAR